MDSCFPLVKTSSVSSALTVAHLIRNIEQLKNKDKLISQLEKDLGRQSWGGAAHFAVLERRRSEGTPLQPGDIDLSSHPFRTLPEGSDDPDSFRWTPTSIQTPGDVEDAWTNTMEGNVSLGKADLPSQLKGTKDRNSRGLVEKCRSYLQQNKELFAQNRAFKESTERATQDNKNAQELMEHSKLQVLQMSRQLNQLKAERGEWEMGMRGVEGLRQELMEDKKMINALRKACSDKDRRIELIQHRKKRRRMLECAEKAKIQSAGLKETPFGYEEDDRQNVDGNQSVCSLSSTISDDSVWDDVLSKEEMERNYQRLMIEQLELQKSHALLQKQTDSIQDPQRENLSKADLQNDLFLSQCRVEQLEHFIREGLQGKSEEMWEIKERMQAQMKSLNIMVKSLEKDNKRLQNELTNAQDRNEDMEFRLVELEQYREKEVPCPDSDPRPATTSTSDKSTEYSPSSSPADSVLEEPTYVLHTSPMMEQLAKELNTLLKDKGRDGQSALKKLDGLIGKEKALESMAYELQMKVSSLQQEKNSLQDKLLLVEQSTPGKGKHSASLAQAKERQENLALKVDFLQKAEAFSVERIDELEAIVEDLRQQLDDKSLGKMYTPKEVHKMTEMKHQMTFLETDNKALTARVSELEENEEILRENWRRVAEEDFNRTQCLEEKVKMLEGLNRELKVKLKDAQEYLVVDMSKISLAAELEESESRLFDDSSDDNADETDDMEDYVDSPVKDSGSDSEKKAIKEKVRKLERQLSEVAEQKNSKIESLQDRLVDLQETEIKLSETISEMEMTERELRAKLALYESSEVTVEKMLKYQSKIEELRTSQESLLDQLEIKEHEGMSLHEKMQELERTLRGKIVTLEVEMKGYKQKELRNAGHIRDLEKQEKELSDKVAQQAEKENSLYIRISSLMDELKAAKTELENVRKQLEDKDDKVRQAKLLEVKLLEIEMECGKKVSTLNAKLRHREEEFRQKESAYEEQITTLQDMHQQKTQMENEFAQKEQDIQHIRYEKDEKISSLTSQISDMQKNSEEATSQIYSLESELESEKRKVCEKESVINSLKEDIKSKLHNLECAVSEKETHHQTLKDSLESEIHLKQKRVSELEEELKEAQLRLSDSEKAEKSEQKAAQIIISDLKSFSDNCISDIEQKFASKMSFLEIKLESVQYHISKLQSHISEQYMNICVVEAERDEQKQMFNEAMLELEKEKDLLEHELKKEISALNVQLEQEMENRESVQSSELKESLEREASLRFDVSNLQHQVEQHKRELITKLSELEAKNKAHCELSLELSNLRHEHKILQKELDKSKQSCSDMALSLKSVISQKDEQLAQSSDTIVQLNKAVEELKMDVDQKQQIIDQITIAKDAVIAERDEENKTLLDEKSHSDNMFSEKCQELDRVNQLHMESEKELLEIRTLLTDRDHIIQKQEQEKGEKEMKLKENESHAQNMQVDKETLTQELHSIKTVLEGAQSQITRQQQELQLLHTNLHSHQEDIKQLQSIIKEKEENLQEKDQMYKQQSTELKKLTEQLQDRDQKIEQADSKVADVELKLQRAENRVRELESTHVSLEMRLEERYAVSQNAEKVLRSKELQCSEMESKLEVAEKNLANLKDQISFGDESSKELVDRLEVKENELQERQLEVSALKDCLEEKESLFSSLESRFNQLEGDVESTEVRHVRDNEEFKKVISEKESLIFSMETTLKTRDSDLKEISSELDSTKSALGEKERYCEECEAQLTHLDESHSSLKSKYEQLECNLHQVTQGLEQKSMTLNELQEKTNEKGSELIQCKEKLSKNSQELTDLLVKLEETEKVLSDKKALIENLSEENQTLKQTVDKLSFENTNVSAKEENLQRELQSKDEDSSILISKLESEKSALASVNESLRKQNSQLQERIEISEGEITRVDKDKLLVNEAKESLSKQLSEIQRDNEILQTKINTLESDLSQSNTERKKMVQDAIDFEEERNHFQADNAQLQKEIEEAAKEFQGLTVSFEESKNNIEKKVQEISNGKQKVEADFEALQKEHKSKTSEMAKLLEGKVEEIQVLKQRCTNLTHDNAQLSSNVESLEEKLNEAQTMSQPSGEGNKVQDEIVCESMIAVNMAPSLHSIPPSQRSYDNVLEAGKNNDIVKDQHALKLESTLSEMKEKEKHFEKRVSELETVEKELREQIVDIEMTVIVPLENENQDLKDEIGIVKQERDEAISKISKWDDDEDDDDSKVQQSETVHQRLEEALMYGEELEKKNEILSVDIEKVEHENESLHVRITDLESSESEKKDEIDNLQQEIDRLHENHHDTSVLEETETTLMDKVLELEEREKVLILERDNLVKTATDSEKSLIDMEGLHEKMKYFEQKIGILEDAEGRYMDKIMELEEDKHRLLSSITENHDTHVSPPHPSSHSSVNSFTVSSSTQTFVPFESNTVLGATDSSDGVDSLYHSDSLSSSGQTVSSSPGESLHKLSVLEEELQKSNDKLEELDAKLREKETLVLYLQDKLELLQDSEGKLMDKLLEAEEKASSIVHSKYSSQINELNKKIDQIQEENEFLAENVEQYKKSFKEEKEKCNNLQGCIMEDSVNLGELQRTQEELVRTQQMVEDIQSEYEDQLSEHVEHENKLKEELSIAVGKKDRLEQVVNAKAKIEEELQEQVERLRSTEKEMRSRLSLMKTTDDDSALSDSGVSADDPRVRNEPIPVVEEAVIHRSVKTVQLATATPVKGNNDPPRTSHSPDPVPLPRYKRKLRQASIEKISHEELVFLVEDLQEREAALKKRVSDLQAIDESDLYLKVNDLESEKLQLERRLRYVEQQNPPTSADSGIPSSTTEESYLKFSSGVPLSSTAMLEKPEDVLNQRIKELEGLDKHNKNTVSELERDREVLHEIARKDKATIHDLNVKIRELQLSERSLKEQVSSLEVSESSFFNKCEELEAIRVQLEDRVHELEIHERRLRELVRKLKLDESRWLSKSGGMENAVAELSANEAQLKRVVQDMEMEKGGLAERLEYMEARIRELESVEVALLARIKDYENNEVIIQNRNVQLENAEAAAHSRASELDVINVNLTQQHKKMVDENAVMAQHLAQLHGQVQELDRRLLSSRDSEIAYKQHVESLQKNESALQKKVREYELREIDSQSAIRELEQTAEINNDKIAALQRSENRLRYRVQDLEGTGGQLPGELTPSHQQHFPQNVEDCQKRILVLQSQVENLKLQLRQALNTAQLQSAANKSDDEEKEKSNTISVDTEEYSQLHAKAALLDEYAYQNEELESSHEQLRDTILQLSQGKGACGHEVEIEVYKRRMESLQTFIRKLKSSLSEGQTTSLLESELDSGPQGETLPARHLQVLESERVLQSVRGLHHNGKADDTDTIESNGGDHATGLAPVEDSMIQAEVVQNMASLPCSTTPEFSNGSQNPEQPTRLEESHWKAIEARKPVTGSDLRGGVNAQPGGRGGNNFDTSSPRHHGNQPSSTPELEDVTGVLNLHSESELSSYHRTTTLNESDSCSSPVPPPRKNRANRYSKSMSDDNSSVNNGSGSDRDQHQQQYSAHNKATANKKHFGDGKSLPLTASNIERQFSSQQHQQVRTSAPLSRFAEDSFYLPSSTQEGVDSLDDDESPPPLPSQGPPSQDLATVSGRSSRASLDEGRRESLDNSTSGLTIRDRIAMIERHLQSTENLRQADVLDKNNKFLKEDITRLEKELEEKRRYINTLESWLSTTEDLLKNKNKQTDREMVEKLQVDLTKLRRELTQSGYRSEDAMLDPAALKTELEHKDKEISNKRIEIESLAQELRRCHKECRSIEGMRRTALDSLRSLEKEFVHIQDTEDKLKKAQAEINSLKVKYDELDQFKNQALAMVQPLQMKVDTLTKTCREKDLLLRRLRGEFKRGIIHPSTALDELTRLERAMNGEGYNTDNSDNASEDLSPRPTTTTATKHNLRARSVSMDELSLYSDTDSLHNMPSNGGPSGLPSHSLAKRQRPTPYINTSRPRSAEAGGNMRSPRRGGQDNNNSSSQSRPSLHHRLRGFDLNQEHFVAIADYDPGLYSQSGRPRYELALREGDQVRVTGPMDKLGYCEAECNGRSGLVPANYLQPVLRSGMNGHHNPHPHSPSRGQQQHPHYQHQQQHHDHHGIPPPPPQFQDNQHYNPNGHQVPDPPHSLHVRGIEDGCVVLAWKPPYVDNRGCNKGFQVKGYMVYVDNQEYEQIPNLQYCQVAIEGLDLSTPHHLEVQSLCSGGHVSPRAQLVFEGMVRVGEPPLQHSGDGDSPLDTDLSSVLNSVHYTKGAKKKVMALYEYSPKDQSPHDYTSFELAFLPGDIISVYGMPRPDGFYHGEMEGKRGLVPACFVEDLASRHGKHGSQDSGHESSKA